MAYDNALVAGKLRRWERYLERFRLPLWDDIPNFGLYMDQVIALLQQYLDYLPPELKEEQFITASTINNYVRTKVMPVPIKKRYYREHIVYLIIILTLKQSLSLAMIRKVIPMGLTTDELHATYDAYARQHRTAVSYFAEQVGFAAAPILGHEDACKISSSHTEEIIAFSAIIGGFTRLLSEKLLLLDDRTLENGGSIE